MSRRVLCGAMSFALVAVALVSFAVAGTISYSETFQTTGEQATSNGSAFANYSKWTFAKAGYANDPTASNAYVQNAGTLELRVNGVAGGALLQGYVTAQNIISKSAFDVSSNPLTVSATVSADGNAGNDSPGLLIGNVRMMFFPGYSEDHNGTIQGIVDLRSEDGGFSLYRTYLGFVPEFATNYATSMTIQEDSTHTNYIISYSVGNFTGSHTLTKTSVGSLGKVGCYMEGSADTGKGSFSNFTVSQVPEPSTTVLVGSGAAGLLFCAWRRRK